MGITQDIDLLRNRFVEQWAVAHPDIRYQLDNITLNPKQAPTETIVRLTVKATSQTAASFAAQNVTSTGMATISVIVPASSGSKSMNQLVDDANSIFQFWQSDDGALLVKRMDFSNIPPNADDPFYLCNVIQTVRKLAWLIPSAG